MLRAFQCFSSRLELRCHDKVLALDSGRWFLHRETVVAILDPQRACKVFFWNAALAVWIQIVGISAQVSWLGGF